MKLSVKSYWNLLSEHIKKQKGMFLFLVFVLITSILFKLLMPQIMRSFIDSAQNQKPLNSLIWAAIAFISVAIMQQFLGVLSGYLSQKVSWKATNELRSELARHALHLDMTFHNETSPGALVERIDGDVTELSNFFSYFAVTLVTNALLLLGILIVVFIEDWRAGLGFSLYSIFAFFLMSRTKNIALPFQKKARETLSAFYGFLEEQLAGTEDIRSSGAVEYSLQKLDEHQATLLVHRKKAGFRFRLISTSTMVILGIGTMLCFALGYNLFTANLITIGTVYLFVHYLDLLEEPLWVFSRQLESFQSIGACTERLEEFKARKNLVESGNTEIAKHHKHEDHLELNFDSVHFSYNKTDAVLKDITFNLQHGRILGLLGKTGCGKTTLARLIFRLYDPDAGKITMNGTDIKSVNLNSLRYKVAMVTQDVQIFKASLRDNIRFFDKSITDDEIMFALKELELTDWLENLGQGLDTQMGSASNSLSSGEAQLVAFTRVFLKKPSIVILDEASSRLDPATELRLERAIEKLLKNRGAIIIAHRLSTVERADDILILEDGEIVEYGSRSDLVKNTTSKFSILLKDGIGEVLI